MQHLWSIQRVVHIHTYIHTQWWHTAAQELLQVQLYVSKAEQLTVAARG